MLKVRLLSPWINDTEGNKPLVGTLAQLPGASLMDLTGQQSVPPDINLALWELWLPNDAGQGQAYYDALEADGRFLVISSEDMPDGNTA